MVIENSSENKTIYIDLFNLYTALLTPFIGPKEAQELVKESIGICEKQSIEDGTNNLPNNFGEIVVYQLSKNPGYFCEFVTSALNDGASTEDIIEYWNMPDLERRMAEWSDNIFNYATLKQIEELEKIDNKSAMEKVRKVFPYYGNPNDETQAKGEDRPLSIALRNRIIKYSTKIGDQIVLQESQKFTSYNAYIREMIRKGFI